MFQTCRRSSPNVALFHSSFGVCQGVLDAADRLRNDGHSVLVVDQYGGRVFDNYAEADRFVEQLGFPATDAPRAGCVRDLPDGFIAAGFSNGGGMAEYVATQGRCDRVLLISGALPVRMLGASCWPRRVPVQIHYMTNDPRHRQEWVDAYIEEVRAADAPVELFEYPGSGHLFTDASLPNEYDAEAAELLWSRALAFCRSTH